MDDAEDGGVGPAAEGESENGNGREARRLAQGPEGVAHGVTHESIPPGRERPMTTDAVVERDEESSRFVIHTGKQEPHLRYNKIGNQIILEHTEVPPALR